MGSSQVRKVSRRGRSIDVSAGPRQEGLKEAKVAAKIRSSDLLQPADEGKKPTEERSWTTLYA